MILLLAALALCGGAPFHAQGPEGAERLLERFHAAVTGDDPLLLDSLFTDTMPAAEVAYYRHELLRSGAVRRVVRDRARIPLDPREGEGLRVALDVFEERPLDARLLTTSLLLRPTPGGRDEWRIAGVEGLSALEGLYRLGIDTAAQYDAAGLELAAPDLHLQFESGALFPIESAAGVAGFVFTGRGRMQFTPAPESERLQLRLFSGDESLATRFEALLIRFHPADVHRLLPADALRPVPVDDRAARRAAAFAARELPASLLVDLGDVSAEAWYLLPGESDVLAEIRTNGHGTLTYSRMRTRAEDVSLVRRDRRLTIALYTSAANLAAVGRSYNEEHLRDYDVLDYQIDVSAGTDHRRLQGEARLRLRTLGTLSSLTLRLADTLAVYRITSPELGPLGFVRASGQRALVVRLPRTLPPDTPLTLDVAYAGSVEPQPLDAERMQDLVEPAFWTPEPRLLLSFASDWYPQNPYVDFATATLRIAAPAGLAVVASGAPVHPGGSDASPAAGGEHRVFRADRPLRYLSLLVSRLAPVDTRTLALGAPGGQPLHMEVVSNPLQEGEARNLADSMEDVLRFYAGLLGDVPYPRSTLAVVDAALPGGHSPGYFLMLQNPIMTSPLVWRRDPAAFRDFPEFFLAHELAHQWWGQAVGPKNYRERWISEGFAQYFAAMYAEHARGEGALHDMLSEFRRWSLSESEMGPVALGGRLGHIEGGGRVFRAIVYNKGAAVLHMLRRLVGDDLFVRGLRRFYHEHRFSAAGTDEVQRAFEAEAGRPLERFFDRWIRGADLPTVRTATTITPDAVRVTLEQVSEGVFDLPVTVSVVYRDGRVDDHVVIMGAARLDRTIPTAGEVRRVEINRDNAALAEFRSR